jgi:hypothetical protein
LAATLAWVAALAAGSHDWWRRGWRQDGAGLAVVVIVTEDADVGGDHHLKRIHKMRNSASSPNRMVSGG